MPRFERSLRFSPALIVLLFAPACSLIAGLGDYRLTTTSSSSSGGSGGQGAGGTGGQGTGGAMPASPSGLATGMRHACAIRGSDGRLRCWGDNTYGQLALGPDEGLAGVPTAVPGVDVVKRVAAGAGHTCAILESEDVICWGDNSFGAVGALPAGSIEAPRPVGLQAAGIAAGNDFTCIISSEDTGRGVKCWGNNSAGSLGRPGESSPQPAPTMQPIDGASAIATCPSCQTVCAVRDRRAFCWGGGSEHAKPTDVGQADVVAVAVGSSGPPDEEDVVFLLDGAGRVTFTRRAADGNFPAPNPYAQDVAQIAAGSHVCAILKDGDLQCSGRISGTVPAPPLITIPVTTPPDGAREIRVGVDFMCARTDTAVECTGLNSHGQLGDGKPQAVTRPVKVAEQVDRMTVGAECVTLQKDQELFAFGRCQVYANKVWLVPTAIPVAAVQGYASLFHTGPAIGDVGGPEEDRRGYFYAGTNFFALRDGVMTPVLIDATNPHQIKRIVLTEQWDAVLRQDGGLTITAVADDVVGYGVLDSTTPVALKSSFAVPPTVAGFAAARWARHLCIWPAMGHPHCWGDNNAGQSDPSGTMTGVTTFSDSSPVDLGDSAASISGDVIAMAVGDRHTCAIRKADGKVLCWGSDDLGQLGGGSAGFGPSSTRIPQLPAYASRIAAGRDFTCAVVDSDQYVYCWGNNAFGACGNGALRFPEAPAQVDLPSQTIIQIEAGTGMVCARTQSKDVYCWGNSPFGQVGNGSVGQRSAWAATRPL